MIWDQFGYPPASPFELNSSHSHPTSSKTLKVAELRGLAVMTSENILVEKLARHEAELVNVVGRHRSR